MFYIGCVRRALFINRDSKWNAFVRETTAKLEGTFLIRSKL